MPCRRTPSPRPPPWPSRSWIDRRGMISSEKRPSRSGRAALSVSGVIVSPARPSRTLGSLVQRELAAVRLTEGLTRKNLTPQPVSTTPPSKIGDFCRLPLHGGGIGSAPVVRGKSNKYLAHANLPQSGKRPCRNGQTGRAVSIGEMELEKGIIMLLGGEIACFVSGRRGSCAVTKIPACYLTVPII